MEELNTMLAELADDGALESSGVFTLSLEKAQEKLAAYRLVNPGLFVLNLLAAAVTSGSTSFTVVTQENVTSFSFDARAEIAEDQLERLFSYILEPSAPAYLRELALAVHSARVMPGNPALSLLVSTSRMCQELVVKENETQVLRAPPRPPGIVLQLDYPERGAWSRLFSRQNGRRADVVSHLFHFCRYAPLDVRNNGKSQGARLTLGVYDASVFAWRHARGAQPMRAVAAERRFDLLISRKTESPIASSMLIALMSETPGYQNEGLLLISRGVTFRRPQSLLGFPMAQAAITADHLEKNLSQSDLVEDEAYNELLDHLRAEVEDLILELCVNPPPGWHDSVRRVFAYALDERYPASAGPAPIPVETFRRLATLEARCRTAEGMDEQMAFWRSLIEPEPKAAERFRQELLGMLKAQANRGLAERSWSDVLNGRRYLGELEGRPFDVLTVVLMALAGQEEEARPLLTPQTPGYSPALAYLLGWLDELEGDSELFNLLRFQRAVERQDFATADPLAEHLQKVDGSPLLLLWLGWYAVARKRYSEACRLWDAAIDRLGPRDADLWATLLWHELSGHVSFVDQVRWQVKRSFEELRRSVRVGSSPLGWSGAGEHFGKQPLSWATEAWRYSLRGNPERTAEVFRQGLLVSLIDARDLTLKPLTRGSTGFF